MLKTKSKMIIALIIVAVAMCILGVNSVQATDEHSLDSIPDVLETGISTTQAIDQHASASNELKNIIKSNITDDISNTTLFVSFSEDITELKIMLLNHGTKIAEKTVTAVYNDVNWNETDKQYILNNIKSKDLSLNLEVTEKLDIHDYNVLMEYFTQEYTNLINDDSIECTFVIGSGEWGVDYGYDYSGYLTLKKNGVIYYSMKARVTGCYVLTIPDNIEDTEQAYIDYALPIIRNRMQLDSPDEYPYTEITMEKGANKDEYTINYELVKDNGHGNWSASIILRKEKSNAPVVQNITKTDEDTNIKLETNTNVVPVGIVLNAEKIESEKTINLIVESLKDISDKFVAYDITLTSSGVAIQPNGKVKISIPVPSDYDKTKIVVYRVAEDGTKTKYDTTIDGDYVIIETDHFSTYVVAENNIAVDEETTTETTQISVETTESKLDQTPKTGNKDMLSFVLMTMVMSGAGIVLLKNKE